jgi:hypothetical protein
MLQEIRSRDVCSESSSFGSKAPRTNFILGTIGMKKPAFYRYLVGAVGIEIASLQNKSCTVNGIVPPPQFQLLLNVVNYDAPGLNTAQGFPGKGLPVYEAAL